MTLMGFSCPSCGDRYDEHSEEGLRKCNVVADLVLKSLQIEYIHWKMSDRKSDVDLRIDEKNRPRTRTKSPEPSLL